MTVHTKIAVETRNRHRRLAVAAVVAVFAAILASTAVAVTAGARGSAASTRPRSIVLANSPAMTTIMALTPERLAAGAFDSRYALPAKQARPTMAAVLASMSPATRRYTKQIMSLTFAQLAAGAAGSP
jgi:hypothetical protein